jgi:signal transduction histidine kinase
MAEGVNIEPAMAIGSGAVTEAPAVQRRSVRGWSGGGPLARAVARAPVSVRTKLLFGFGVMVALLVVVAAAGLLALRQSNSRLEQLRGEQQRVRLFQTLLGDANRLQARVQHRVLLTAPAATKDVTPESNAFYYSLDSKIQAAAGTLIGDSDAGAGIRPGLKPVTTRAYLQRWYPAFNTTLQRKLSAFTLEAESLLGLDAAGRGGPAVRPVAHERALANSVAAGLEPLLHQAQGRTNALVADNRSSFVRSRNLLIGVVGGSLALALALALLLSWSLVAPLRATGARMAGIAAGDFTGHLEVPNRDEIGTLAANVNQMSDELGRVYQELETASRHKSDFLATMSHELRTPLNAIIGFSEVLNEQMFGELNERQLAYVDDILAAGQHLLSLINDVLDLAKIEAGRIELEPTEVAVPDLLRSATSMQAESADRGGIEIGLTTDPEEITVIADERRVRQVVFNLLSNAIKFTPVGGRVEVSARRENGVVEIAVADTGPGIPRDDQDTIFQEFEQSPSSKGAEGTGLGLPLSRKLVELHGGRLWLESEVGSGSTFRFTLPLAQEP